MIFLFGRVVPNETKGMINLKSRSKDEIIDYVNSKNDINSVLSVMA